jgi:carbamoyl-phosphate synthase large subunit
MFKFLRKNGMPTPLIYEKSSILENIDFADLNFPLVLKPDIGQGSYNVHIVNDVSEFRFFYGKIENPVIQQYVLGHHYTMDCFCDLTGQLKVCVPRKRLIVEGGSSIVSEIVNDEPIQELAYSLSNKITITGPWNFQVIMDRTGYFITDINPRIAGGLVYSIIAGVLFQKYIVDSLLGISIQDWEYKINSCKVVAKYKDFVAL